MDALVVGGYRGKIMAGVTVIAPLAAIDDDPDSEIARDLRSAVQETSREAGQNSIHYLDV